MRSVGGGIGLRRVGVSPRYIYYRVIFIIVENAERVIRVITESVSRRSFLAEVSFSIIYE